MAARYAKLIKYNKLNKYTNVLQYDTKNKQLAHWVMTQQRQYRLLKENKKNNMTTEQINLLEEIDFKWSLISTVIVATEISSYYLFIKIFNYKCKTVIIPPALIYCFFFPFFMSINCCISLGTK